MSPPKMVWEMNINTLLTILGFLLTIGAGAMAYSSFETESRLRQTDLTNQIVELKSQRISDVTRLDGRTNVLENNINNLNIQDARQIEQIAAMISYLQRIERTLDGLAKREVKQP